VGICRIEECEEIFRGYYLPGYCSQKRICISLLEDDPLESGSDDVPEHLKRDERHAISG